MSTVRAGSLLHFEAAALAAGLDPQALLRRRGLEPSVLEDSEARIPAAAVAALLEDAAARSGRSDFGLTMAQAWSLADMGPVSLAIVHQENLSGALHALMRHRARLSDAVGFKIRETADLVFVTVQLSLPPEIECRQMAEFITGKLRNLCRAVVGEGWTPAAAAFRHAAPKDLSAHWIMFGRTLEFQAETDGLVVRRADFDLRAPRVLDPAFRRHAETLVECLPSSLPDTVCDKAARLIRAGLAEGSANLNAVAGALRLNPRTLQRRLQAEGMGFSDLLDHVRRELAEIYLRDRSLPMSRVAELLGYADGSAFTRWFTEQFRTPPSRWRERPTLIRGGPVSEPASADAELGLAVRTAPPKTLVVSL